MSFSSSSGPVKNQTVAYTAQVTETRMCAAAYLVPHLRISETFFFINESRDMFYVNLSIYFNL